MLYLGYFGNKANEGGLARNNAFLKYFLEMSCEIKNLYPITKGRRLKNLFYGLFELKKTKNEKIIFHLNTIPTIFISKLLEIKLYRSFIYRIFEELSQNNQLIIEVNDLSYEQGKDLELPTKEYWLEIEEKIYILKNTHYIFASNLMRDYIVKKYNLEVNNTSVIINGGPKLNEDLVKEARKYINKNDKIKYIYAGSMNKGRQIEELINIFKNKTNIELYLIGIWGEWIKEEVKDENIIYLGNFEESLAQVIVSHCDIGIIPYDDTRFYYNLCYPTKASFYITAGIPFLCTNLEELKNVFSREDVVWFEDIKNWENKISEIDEREIKQKKENVNKIKDRFLWENLLEKLKLE